LIRIKKRLKRKKAWGKGYLDEMARNQVNILLNGYSDEQMVKFLLKAGFSVNEIFKEARSVQKVVVRHYKNLARGRDESPDRHSRRHKNH